jgi:hypothetical protein
MRPVVDLLKAARERRDLASRARKWAEVLHDRADKLRRYAEELDQQAIALEKEAEEASGNDQLGSDDSH